MDNTLLHEKTFDIAWGDMDALNHVNHAVYFNYFQEARIEWLRDLNITMTDHCGPVILKIEAIFLKPVVYPATLVLKTGIVSIGKSSMDIYHRLYQNNTLMTEGLCKIVWVDYKKGQAIALPESIRTYLKMKIQHAKNNFDTNQNDDN